MELIDERTAAAYLNVTVHYLYQLLDSGALPYTQRGSARFINSQVLIDYAKQRQVMVQAALDELTNL